MSRALGAALIALLSLAFAIGCGDSSEDEATSADSTEIAGGGGDGDSKGKGKGGDESDGKGGDGSGGKGSGDKKGRGGGSASLKEGLANIPAEDRQRFSQTAATSSLKALGFPNSNVTVSDDGYTVFIALDPKYACGVDASKIDQIEKSLEAAIITARRFRLNVQGGGPLKRYIRTECPELTIPEAGGELLYSESGTGTRGSDEFKVRAKRWAVTYVNRGGALKITVVEGKDIVKPRIKSDGAETGKVRFRGPGMFRVIMQSAGRWQVRAYGGK